MTYSKPYDINYTQMAMWIDEHVYHDDVDQITLYEYLYHLVLMLARVNNYFNNSNEYDQFALYGASRCFQRLLNKKQFEFNEDGTPKVKKIKSVLNYLKKVLYPYKVDFELEFIIENKNFDTISIDNFDVGINIVESASLFDKLEFSLALDGVASIVKSHLKRIPVRKNSVEWTNIYISCMLTLINSITLPEEAIAKYVSSNPAYNDNFLDRVYLELKYQEPVLYHLPQTMSNYIKVLVNELKHVLAAEISWEDHSYISAEATIKNLINQAYFGEEE